jgi:hypothetical protein
MKFTIQMKKEKMVKRVCKYFWVGLLLLALPTVVSANDFEVEGVGGSWQPIKEKNNKIRMVKESVRINISGPTYEVTADFTFKNNGPAKTINMAFPERGEGAGVDPRHDIGFTRFVTYVNGKSTKVRRVITKTVDDGSDGSYQALWIKQVSFKQGETKQVRVAYHAVPGNQAGKGFFASYDFTGQDWSGDVAESTLTVKLDPHLKFLKSTFKDKQFQMHRGGGEFTAGWTNWQAQGHFQFWFNPTKATSRSVQQSYWPSPGAPRYTVPLTANDLRGKSNQQLDVMRNTIYARYGREFKRSDLRNYFSHQSWYHYNPNFKESLLTPVERRNAAFILQYQKGK